MNHPKLHSFRSFPSARPLDYRTPSPPPTEVVFAPVVLTAPKAASQSHSRRKAKQHDRRRGNERKRVARNGEETESDEEMKIAPIQTKWQGPSNGDTSHIPPSPIDTLASVAIAANPSFNGPSPQPNRSELGHHSDTLRPLPRANGQQHLAPPFSNHLDPSAERPHKRIRSDAFPSPEPQNQNWRPATSYTQPSNSNSFWVEAGQKPHPSRHVRAYSQSATKEKSAKVKASEAELLLSFSREVWDKAYQSDVKQSDVFPFAPHGADKEHLGPGHQHSYRHSSVGTIPAIPEGGMARYPGGAEQPPLHGLEAFANMAPSSHGDLASAYSYPESQHLGVNGKGRHIKDEAKPRNHKGWPKGKPRGPRKSNNPTAKSSSEVLSKPAVANATAESLPFDIKDAAPPGTHARRPPGRPRKIPREWPFELAANNKPLQTSFTRSSSLPPLSRSSSENIPISQSRSASVPPANANMAIVRKPSGPRKADMPNICAVCGRTEDSTKSEGQGWIKCNGCSHWHHFACAGVSEKETRNIDKFFCKACERQHGPTTYVRKSARAHNNYDYAALNEGGVRMNEDNPEHHYISAFKDGSILFQPETFPRMRPELVTAEYFERCGGMTQPIVIPAWLNPRPVLPDAEAFVDQEGNPDNPRPQNPSEYDAQLPLDYAHESVPDDGQDKLDMVIPQGLTVRRVAELYGVDEKIEVIDVKTQNSGEKGWTMRKFADYYEQEGDKVVRNVISLEVSNSKLGRMVRRPKLVRDLDLQDAVWPAEEREKGTWPKVQFYCLMSVCDCYTDFHIDFGGSSVYYHILKGKKTFFFIPPEPKYLKQYEDWNKSESQNHTWLPNLTGECYRVDLSEGDTMLIPSGWIHAVWTPADSLVIGGNFLTRLNFGNQFKVVEIEKATGVPRKFRYPFFQRVMWYSVIDYLKNDPLPRSVQQAFYDGKRFERMEPVYNDFDGLSQGLPKGDENYNARFYSEPELNGLPQLLSYIWRTVLISLGKVDGIANETKNSVNKSLPKGHGDPMDIARSFAMWVAWKRGNEDVPQWAHPDYILPETDAPGAKKLSTAAIKQMERQAAIDAYRLINGRQPPRQASQAAEAKMAVVKTSPAPTGESPSAKEKPKASMLGPKRVACEYCRRRRIRCKHKDEPLPDDALPMHPLATSANVPASEILEDQATASHAQVVSTPIPQTALSSPTATKTSLQQQPYEMSGTISPEDGKDGKKRRTKACMECRRSKRRCVHDEFGNVDPVKVAEASQPRPKRKVDSDSPTQNKKQKTKSADLDVFPLDPALAENPYTPATMNGISTSPSQANHSHAWKHEAGNAYSQSALQPQSSQAMAAAALDISQFPQTPRKPEQQPALDPQLFESNKLDESATKEVVDTVMEDSSPTAPGDKMQLDQPLEQLHGDATVPATAADAHPTREVIASLETTHPEVVALEDEAAEHVTPTTEAPIEVSNNITAADKVHVDDSPSALSDSLTSPSAPGKYPVEPQADDGQGSKTRHSYSSGSSSSNDAPATTSTRRTSLSIPRAVTEETTASSPRSSKTRNRTPTASAKKGGNANAKGKKTPATNTTTKKTTPAPTTAKSPEPLTPSKVPKVTPEKEDDESVRLARMLAEEEWGLRKRKGGAAPVR